MVSVKKKKANAGNYITQQPHNDALHDVGQYLNTLQAQPQCNELSGSTHLSHALMVISIQIFQ